MIRGFAGRLKKWGNPTRFAPFRRAMKEPAHLALHPFGQIPTYEEGDLALFETGSIVFHIAERHAGLLPDDANTRARATPGCLPRSTPWSRPSLNSEPQAPGGRQALE